jgi:hypothetical protein
MDGWNLVKLQPVTDMYLLPTGRGNTKILRANHFTHVKLVHCTLILARLLWARYLILHLAWLSFRVVLGLFAFSCRYEQHCTPHRVELQGCYKFRAMHDHTRIQLGLILTY